VKNIDEIIANNILKRAAEKGWSQQKLAKLANIKATNLNQIIKMKRRPGRKTLTALARALECEWYDFQEPPDRAGRLKSEPNQADLVAVIDQLIATAGFHDGHRSLALYLLTGAEKYGREYKQWKKTVDPGLAQGLSLLLQEIRKFAE
jgi:transcriptional regulator with XRE-family HTH domain